MKKILLIIYLMVYEVFFLYSVEPNCRNDCYETIPYILRNMLIDLSSYCPACTVKVVFLTRFGICEGRQVRDMYIESMTGLSGACNGCGYFENLSDIMRIVLEKLLDRYFWEDLPDDEKFTVDVKYPPCIRHIGKRSRVFCLNGECCIHRYHIMQNFDPPYFNIIEAHEVVDSYEGECPRYEEGNNIIQCENICSVHVSPSPIILGSNEVKGTLPTDIFVVPNASKEQIEIKLSDTIRAVCCEIYNSYGDLVQKLNLEGRDAINLLASNYGNGLYFMRIRTSAGNVLRTRIVIIK